jgi:hypothetical protein
MQGQKLRIDKTIHTYISRYLWNKRAVETKERLKIRE